MEQSTRTALKLAPGASHAEAAAALAKGGHELTHLGLQKTDSDFLLYLKREHPATHLSLYQAQYGKPTAPDRATPSPAAQPLNLSQGQQQLLTAAMRGEKSIRDLENEAPAMLLQLKREYPADYKKLFDAYYKD